MDEIKVVLRPFNFDDAAFVSHTWAQNLYYNPLFEIIPEEIYFKWFPKLIAKVIKDPTTETMIACDESHPEWIVGSATYSKEGIYWVYVKKDFRNQGIARLLLKDCKATQVISPIAITKTGKALAEKKNFTYQPL